MPQNTQLRYGARTSGTLEAWSGMGVLSGRACTKERVWNLSQTRSRQVCLDRGRGGRDPQCAGPQPAARTFQTKPLRDESCHAAYSVADARPTSRYTSRSSVAAEPGDRAAEPRSADAKSSSCRCSSCGLRVRAAALQAPFEELSQTLSADFLGVHRLVGANNTDLVGAWSTVQAGVAFGLRQRPESHGPPL